MIDKLFFGGLKRYDINELIWYFDRNLCASIIIFNWLFYASDIFIEKWHWKNIDAINDFLSFFENEYLKKQLTFNNLILLSIHMQ